MLTERKIEHSQNFICQPKLVQDLLSLSSIGRNDLVVEIGPGKGIITQELLRCAGYVIAVEQDARFAEHLSLLTPQSNLRLVICDFLSWQLPQEQFKVFANIPFNHTADIVTRLTSAKSNLGEMYLIMQEAAAHRFAGVPYVKNSQASILLAIDFSVELLRKISPSYFKPKPNVSIVFVHFARRTRPLVSENNRQSFRDFVVYGYNQWAPTLIDAFKDIFSRRQLSIIAKTHDLTGLKPSDLTLDQWLGLFDTYCKYVSEDKKKLVFESERRLKKMESRLDKQHRTRKIIKHQKTFA